MLTLIAYTQALAGDLPEALVTDENADVFLCEITKIDEEFITLSVSEALFENYDVATITIKRFEYFTLNGRDRIPEVGDYCAIAAEFKDNEWKLMYPTENTGMAAKSDSLDKKTLKLYTGENKFLERMNEYINNGHYSAETRKEIFKRQKGDEPAGQSEEQIKALTEARELTRISQETQIVPPAPKVVIPQKKPVPIIRYALTTLAAAVLSYFFARYYACRGKRKD